MVDFAQAFQKGLEAAEVSKPAKVEILQILLKMRKDILNKSEGKISIEFELGDPVDEMNDIGKMFSHSSLFFGSEEPKITAKRADKPKDSEFTLATWSMGSYGYPCRLKYAGKELICEDGEAFQNALAELLMHPTVGEKLFALLEEEVA
jgi:hypothetical protein